MGLPETDAPWPPRPLQPGLDRMATWRAWWAGDPDLLASHYGGGAAMPGHPAQRAGGVLGKLARMWWGRPAAKHEPDTKLHVPLAGDICRTSANMLFGEPFTATAKAAATTAALAELLDAGAQMRLLEAAELQAAMGGVYLRPVSDPAIADRAWLDAVSPDAALPEWKWGRLSACTFWRIVHRADGFVWRHLERHEPGWIVHTLWEGDDASIGRMVPLEDHPATAPFARQVNEAMAIETDYPRLTACYVPNMRPAPLFEHNPLLAPMGKSDLDGIEQTLDALDEVYSSWMRDVRLAKGRIIVGDAMLDDQGPGKGARFDPDREAFTVAEGLDPKDVPLTVAQFDIRVEQHRATAHELMTVALRKAGYALITLGEVEGGQAITATEVKAKGQLSFVTQGRKRGYWTPVLENEALPALLAVDASTHGRPMPNLDGINVEWPDSIAEDLASLAATVEVASRAAAMSTQVKVETLHPDWDEILVTREVGRILEETAAATVTVAPFNDGLDGAPSETQDLRTRGEVDADEDRADADAAA